MIHLHRYQSGPDEAGLLGEDSAGPSCYVILSTKSSGSSILQKSLSAAGLGTLLGYTHHYYENETLFWTKAASILGLPQHKLENSEVPMTRRRAKRLLGSLIRQNVEAWDGALETEQDIFSAWTILVTSQPKALIEKSPHHLYQPSAIRLLERYVDSSQAVRMRFVGLVRNPVSTLYSSWRRLGVRPEHEERHWIRAYRLLLELKQRRPSQVIILRYEDIVAQKVSIRELFGSSEMGTSESMFHNKSLDKWRLDRNFGYQPSRELVELAARYGYQPEDLANPNAGPWGLYREPRALIWNAFSKLPVNLQRRSKTMIKSLVRS
jgi:hypothetical protein